MDRRIKRVSNFNHSFKRRFGMSPRQYRASHDMVGADPAR